MIFVYHTPDSQLAKKLRLEDHKMADITGARVKDKGDREGGGQD